MGNDASLDQDLKPKEEERWRLRRHFGVKSTGLKVE